MEDKREILEDNYKALATAVILQACKDYKAHPEMRYSIINWIKQGNPFCALMLSDYDEKTIIQGVKNYGKKVK